MLEVIWDDLQITMLWILQALNDKNNSFYFLVFFTSTRLSLKNEFVNMKI